MSVRVYCKSCGAEGAKPDDPHGPLPFPKPGCCEKPDVRIEITVSTKIEGTAK